MTVHIGIIDQDPVQLVTALLHRSFQAKKMIFIGVAEQQEQYQQLQRVVTSKGIETDFFIIPTDINISAIKAAIQTLADELHQQHQQVYFNASCGLRHHLLAAYEVFRGYQWPVYVIEDFNDELCWLTPEHKPAEQIEDHIGIRDYLTLFGAECDLEPNDIYQNLQHCVLELGSQWANNARELDPGLATLNYLATACRKAQCLSVELSDKQQGYRELGMLIDDLINAQLASYQQGVLTFASEEARRFANGEWLECYVYHLVQDIQQQLNTIQDHTIGQQVHRKVGGQDIRNELDVAAVVNNKMHIIECKTKSMATDGDDTLYKLESIRDLLGGLQARAMLVSFRPLKQHDITRATELGLALVGPDQLPELKAHLYRWFLEAGGVKNQQHG